MGKTEGLAGLALGLVIGLVLGWREANVENPNDWRNALFVRRSGGTFETAVKIFSSDKFQDVVFREGVLYRLTSDKKRPLEWLVYEEVAE